MNKSSYLIVHKDYPVNAHGVNSGAETATLWLARTLVRLGQRVVVAAELTHSECTIDGVEYWDLGKDYNVASVIERARGLGSYHLLAACRSLAIQLSRNESACLSRHLVAHDPSAGAIGVKPEALCRMVDGVICVSEAQKELFVKEGGDANKITVIPNGADLTIFRPATFTKRNLKRIVFAGALVQDKGVDILIRAFVHVKAMHPDATLDVYGSSKMWGRAELFNHREIEAQLPGIKFHGSVPQTEVAKAFQECAVNVIPSRWFDSFPLTAVEAEATGCPIVAFDVGGIKEAITPDITGILVSEISEISLAKTLSALLSDPKRLESMSQAAIELVKAKFSWEQIAKRFINVCEATQAKITQKQLGVITTWNQTCGLATYGKFLFSKLEGESFTILSEETTALKTSTDESFVVRCWQRNANDFSKLEQQIISKDIGLVHINAHNVSFINPKPFGEMLARIKAKGVKVVMHLHSTFTVDPNYQYIIPNCDQFIVHTEQNRLEVIANGATPQQVTCLPHGVNKLPILSDTERETLRSKLGFRHDEQIIIAFGFVQPHKGMEGVLETVVHLRAKGRNARGVIVGSANKDDANSEKYLAWLKAKAVEIGISDYVAFLDRFISDEEVGTYLQAADLVLMNYRSQHFEASGACSLAVGAGAVVCTSLAPPFMPFSGAVWQITSGYPAPIAAELLLGNKELYRAVKAAASEYAIDNQWIAIAQQMQRLYRERCSFNATPRATATTHPEQIDQSKTVLKVLIQNRPNTFTQCGGDTIVIERTVEALKALGVSVTIDVEGKARPQDYDLVHLFNFALPDLTKYFAERAVECNVPYVVTTLSEDLPTFHTQSHATGEVLMEYVTRGQNKEFWTVYQDIWTKVAPSQRFNNEYTATHAAALMPNGSREALVLKRDYPTAKNIIEVPLGYEVNTAQKPDPNLFINQYGVRDFVLCVGRLETRKNQLMLLKALEDSDITVVLAAGGFTYQPNYAEACRKFKRKGRTIVLERLSPEMLASAYAAAKVHALPSWYELPGLVSLEAVAYGCNVVVTDNGTARDYLGDYAYYCKPQDEVSIKNAVLKAYNEVAKPEMKAHIEQYQWDRIGVNTLKVYNVALGKVPEVTPLNKGVSMTTHITSNQPITVTGFGSFDADPDVTKFQEHLDRGEVAAKSQDLATAHAELAKAEQLNPNSARMLKVRGTVYLAEDKVDLARVYFERAKSIDSKDARVLCGIGMCELRQSRVDTAYPYFLAALSLEPDSQVAIQQLIVCAYTSGRFTDLERVLVDYTTRNTNDIDMLYCLGGCYTKTGKHDKAIAIAQSVLAKNPEHAAAKELLDHANKAQLELAATIAQQQLIAKPTTTQTVEKIAVPATPQPSITQEISTTSSRIDLELGKLDESKRHKKYDEVKRGTEEILARKDLTPEQREFATCLRAEIDVLHGESATAEKMYLEVLDKNPASARALCGRAVIAANTGRWDEARGYFERANTYKPHYDLALAGLGLCAWQGGDMETAWTRFEQALKANPENTRALLGLIQIGYPQKKFIEIENAIKNYLEIHPADLDWVYSLAGVYFAQNKLDEATDAINQITLFRPGHEKAIELQQMITAKREGREMPVVNG